MSLTKMELRRLVLKELRASGFRIRSEKIFQPNLKSKRTIRRLHQSTKQHILADKKEWILENEPKVFDFFADGSDITPSEIYPKMIMVKDDETANLFRYASFLWSIPISSGFGRRIRYVIIDENSGKLIGLLGLTDPVIGIKVRDDWIGWTKEQKEKKLWHVMDAFVFGAVPPYNYLLGGKLIATCAVSEKVRRDFKKKYAHKKSIIEGRVRRNPNLALITTTGAFGESSILDRLKYNGDPLWQLIGFTEGFGHFHLNNGLQYRIQEYLEKVNDPIVRRNRFGQGPNWKMRMFRQCFKRIGFDYNKLGRHGIKRGFYVAPLAENTKEFLRGEESKPKFYPFKLDDMFSFFRERYLLPRAQRDLRYTTFRKDDIKLSKVIKRL